MKNIFLFSLLFFGMHAVHGQIWTQVAVPTSEKLLDIEFPPGTQSVGYIGGENGTLLKTTDGGTTWNVVNFSGIDLAFSYSFVDLEFATDLVGYAVVSAGLYKTTDGGSTWTVMDATELGAFCYKESLYVIDSEHFFVGGAGCFQSAMIFEYNNGSWSEKSDDHETFDPTEYVKYIDFYGNIAIAATNGDQFLRSTDNGQNWISVQSPVAAPSGTLSEFVFLDANHIIAGHEIYAGHYLFYESLDGGASWTDVPSVLNGDLIFYGIWPSFEKSEAGTIYAGASTQGGFHYLQRYLNNSWSYEEVDELIISIDSYGQDEAFAVGDNGYVVRNSQSQLGLHQEDSPLQIYPNPTSDYIYLDGVNSGAIKVFDPEGSEIKAQFVPYNKGCRLDLHQCQPGIYILQVEQETEFKQYKVVKN